MLDRATRGEPNRKSDGRPVGVNWPIAAGLVAMVAFWTFVLVGAIFGR